MSNSHSFAESFKSNRKRKFDLSVLVSIIIIIIKAALATLAELAH